MSIKEINADIDKGLSLFSENLSEDDKTKLKIVLDKLFKLKK